MSFMIFMVLYYSPYLFFTIKHMKGLKNQASLFKRSPVEKGPSELYQYVQPNLHVIHAVKKIDCSFPQQPLRLSEQIA